MEYVGPSPLNDIFFGTVGYILSFIFGLGLLGTFYLIEEKTRIFTIIWSLSFFGFLVWFAFSFLTLYFSSNIVIGFLILYFIFLLVILINDYERFLSFFANTIYFCFFFVVFYGLYSHNFA